MMHGEYDVVWSEGGKGGGSVAKDGWGKGEVEVEDKSHQWHKPERRGARHEETGATYTHFIPAIKLNWIKNKLIRSLIKMNKMDIK